MKSIVCQVQHLEVNLLLYGQPMKLTKNWGDMFISPSYTSIILRQMYHTHLWLCMCHAWLVYIRLMVDCIVDQSKSSSLSMVGCGSGW